MEYRQSTQRQERSVTLSCDHGKQEVRRPIILTKVTIM